MGANSGYVVEFMDAEGKKIRGYALYNDQEPEFQPLNKVLIRPVGDDAKIMKDENGRDRRILKDLSAVIFIGYID